MMHAILFAIGMLMGACAATALACCKVGADAEKRAKDQV